jgi:hypothetical protein
MWISTTTTAMYPTNYVDTTNCRRGLTRQSRFTCNINELVTSTFPKQKTKNGNDYNRVNIYIYVCINYFIIRQLPIEVWYTYHTVLTCTYTTVPTPSVIFAQNKTNALSLTISTTYSQY